MMWRLSAVEIKYEQNHLHDIFIYTGQSNIMTICLIIMCVDSDHLFIMSPVSGWGVLGVSGTC